MLNASLQKHELMLTCLDSIENIQQFTQDPADILIINEEKIPVPALDTLKLLMQIPDPPSVIVLTESGRDRQAGMLAAGCEVVLSTGTSPDIICKAVDSILRKHIVRQNEILKTKRLISEPRLSDFVSQSRSMQTFLNLVKKVVHTDSSLLILGETGVGKERLALAIHGESKRKNSPFIAVNCAALPENLLESELFGHEKGAFTGAVRTRRGAFELAHKGTIFLDEIGDIPIHLQTKLLRAIQEKQFQKVGGENAVNVDVRIMAATNRDLATEVKEGRFRKDLYYRLSVICLNIPPLSERREDIPELVRNYINYLAPRIGVPGKDINADAMQALIDYHWPGNVRELINVIERAMLLCEGGWITPAELPEEVSRHVAAVSAQLPVSGITGQSCQEWAGKSWKKIRNEVIHSTEKKYLSAMLDRHAGRVYSAAAEAGITPRAFYQKLNRHSIAASDSRNKISSGDF